MTGKSMDSGALSWTWLRNSTCSRASRGWWRNPARQSSSGWDWMAQEGVANGSRLQYVLLHWMKEEGSLLVSVVGRLIELKTAQNRADDEEFGLELEGNDLPVFLWRTVWRSCRKQRTG